MFSQDPLSNLFDIELTVDFFKADICKPFNDYYKLIDGSLDNIQDAINESIQGLNIPGWGYDRVAQQQVGYQDGSTTPVPTTQWFRPNIAGTNLVETKEFEIIFRHLDGYMNYYCLLMHFHKWFSFDNKSSFCMQALPIGIKNPIGQKIGTLLINRVMFIGMSGLSLGYDKVNRQFETFSCRFGFDNMSIEYALPVSTANGHIIIVDTNFGDTIPNPATHDITLSSGTDQTLYFKYKDQNGVFSEISDFTSIRTVIKNSAGDILQTFDFGDGMAVNPRDTKVAVLIKSSDKTLPIGNYTWEQYITPLSKAERLLMRGVCTFI